jgi:hypothetical protein
MTWIGRRKLALVPLYRPNAHPPDQIPDDWPEKILQRALFDPDPVTGADRSLRAFIHTASSGRADLDVVVRPMEMIDQQDVGPWAIDQRVGAQLRAEGFDAAAIVMLGGLGAGTSSGFWVRFVMLERVGVWAMEFMHSLTGFGDLYPFGGNMGAFDEMACSCATHPSAYTKAAIGWLDPSAIALHDGHARTYQLHSVGLIQPPPSGRVAAVRIGAQVPYFMIEARQKVDQFDANIPSEGVIIYRVQTSDPLGHAQNQIAPVHLLTPTALDPGQFVRLGFNVVSVIESVPGGFTVSVRDTCQTAVDQVAEAQARVNELAIEISILKSELLHASPSEKAAIIQQIKQAAQEHVAASTALATAQASLQRCRDKGLATPDAAEDAELAPRIERWTERLSAPPSQIRPSQQAE